MASDRVLEYSALLEQAVLLIKTCPDLSDNLVEECRHWKGEADRLEVSSCSLSVAFEGLLIMLGAVASGCDSH